GFELAALRFELAVEPGVLDRQRGLGGERLEQLDDVSGEGARRALGDDEPADQAPLCEQGHAKQRTIAEPDELFAEHPLIGARLEDVRDLDGLTGRARPSDAALTQGQRLRLEWCKQLLREPVRGA